MPQAGVIVPAVTGLAGGFLQAGAAKRAGKAQETANREALAFEREKYGMENQRRQEALDDYSRRWAAWDARRRAVYKHLGIDIPGGGGGPAPMGAPAGAQTNLPAVNIGQLARGGGGGGAPVGPVPDVAALSAQAEEGLPEDDGAEWNDWGKYGLR